MMTEKMTEFEYACRIYLTTLSIVDLRNYGRAIGVPRPTTKKKQELIDDILGVLLGRVTPVKVSNQGAPVKNHLVDERIFARIEALRLRYFSEEEEVEQKIERKFVKKVPGAADIHVSDPEAEELGVLSDTLTKGQIHFIGGEYRLLNENCTLDGRIIRIPEELMNWHHLREGDILSCYTRENRRGIIKVAKIDSVNGVWKDVPAKRPVFDEVLVGYPLQRITLWDGKKYNLRILKFMQWLMPLAKGHRGCIISAPKAGKTTVLREIAEAAAALNKDVEVYVLLVEQAPETVGEFQRSLKGKPLFYTTYEDDPEGQILMANMLLNRAKRRAEMGKDLLLIVDSLSALARAYNDTDESTGGKTLSCGLELKTVRYIKKYFGAARRLTSGGSVTILGTVNAETGNPFDDVVCAEFSSLANYEMRLDNNLAMRRIYPALDLVKTSVKQGHTLLNEQEEEFDFYLRNELLPKIGLESVLGLIEESKSYEDFLAAVNKK